MEIVEIAWRMRAPNARMTTEAPSRRLVALATLEALRNGA